MTMRTTIRLDGELLVEAKHLAAKTHRSLTAVIEDALRLSLGLQQKVPARHPIRLKTFRGKGLMPGVNLDDTSALLDLMEAADDPR